VARGVDDVNAGVLSDSARALREDGNAVLAILIVGVHSAFRDLLVFAKGAGPVQQSIEQGGFAVIDVRDDRDVAYIT